MSERHLHATSINRIREMSDQASTIVSDPAQTDMDLKRELANFIRYMLLADKIITEKVPDYVWDALASE